MGPAGMSIKARAETPLPAAMYGPGPYLAYLCFPPLYFSGPICTYNLFASQLLHPPDIRLSAVVRYMLRWLGCLLCLEAVTHALYLNALAKARMWKRPGMDWGPLEFSLTGFWVLLFMWLKFTVTWRFARAASLAAGVDCPENILRCVCNNYDVEGFWRNWHCSFNRWLVRYAYVPLGGSAYRALNVWPIFIFVALWHDLEPQLLGWAMLTCAMFLPEMAAKRAVLLPAAKTLRARPVMYRHVCAAAATANVLMLMTANLVGFVVGMDGIRTFVWQMLQQPRFVVTTLTVIYSTVHLMFDIRAKEAATGRRVCALPAPWLKHQ